MGFGDDAQKVTLANNGEHKFEVKGLMGAEKITSKANGFALCSADGTVRIGSAKTIRFHNKDSVYP